MTKPIVIQETAPLPKGASLWDAALAGPGGGETSPGTRPKRALPAGVRPPMAGGPRTVGRGPAPAPKRRVGKTGVLVVLVALVGALVAMLSGLSGSGPHARTGAHGRNSTESGLAAAAAALTGGGAKSDTAAVPSCIVQTSNPAPQADSTETVAISHAPAGAQVSIQILYPGNIQTTLQGGTTNALGQSSVEFGVRTAPVGSNVGVSAGVGGTSCVAEFVISG